MYRRAIVTASAWGIPALAGLMLALTLMPAQVWKAPADDASYSGFDPNVIFTSSTSSSGSADVSRDAVKILAEGSTVGLNFATTQLQKLSASFVVSISNNQGASEPFRIGVWSPWTGSGEFLVFGGEV